MCWHTVNMKDVRLYVGVIYSETIVAFCYFLLILGRHTTFVKRNSFRFLLQVNTYFPPYEDVVLKRLPDSFLAASSAEVQSQAFRPHPV